MQPAWTFQLRWLLWAAGALGVIAALAYWKSASFKSRIQSVLHRLNSAITPRFTSLLLLVCTAFVLLAWLGKASQLWTFRLNAEDFWLFEDLLRNLARGGFLLSRFAPQSLGMIQHGAVHATWTFGLATPLAWAIGPTQAALLYGPLCLGGAAFFLGLLARARWSAISALAFSGAFLFSTQVGHILNYDVHPEVAYPFAVFALAWSLGLADGKVRWTALTAATLLGIGVKEDSFLVFFPILGWALFALQGQQRKAALYSAVLAALGAGFCMYSIGRFASGAWGPKDWEGLSVIIPPGADLLQGIHWDSPKAAIQVLSSLSQRVGGLGGVLSHWVRFWFSRPWLSILILVPWILLDRRFYLWILPLTFAYSLLQRAAILNLYYSAPFLGIVWTAAILVKRPRGSLAAYALLATLTLGDGAIKIDWPSKAQKTLQANAEEFLRCLPPATRGVVQTTLLGIVPRERVLAERYSPSATPTAAFYFLTPKMASYELDPDPVLTDLRKDPTWVEINRECQPLASVPGHESDLALLVRRNPLR